MKKLLQLMGAIVCIGLLAVSCTKLGTDHDGSIWFANTGDESYIPLTICEGSQQCVINRREGCLEFIDKHDVKWSSRNGFKVLDSPSGTNSILYSGVIKGESLSLSEYNGSSVSATYELERRYLSYN